MLYMATLSVIRQEGIHQHFHRDLRQRGKTSKAALVAVMHKLLVTLNAMMRDQVSWPKQPASTAING